eukprot:CAMPEP_0194283334 /NCGR_PEP_ID=MMETSP0169-20130528/25141_1 /TAXON_ID=218684 /ORGANISM="Corethron pennatum, Strain L29A3" /LENGTH=641 /DNA_ID=CAMNT_0039028907 /DNA_START=136 /DNA_END=2061 /DNA_ORIENTATION=-
MPKTGKGFHKAQPSKAVGNQLKKSNASAKQGVRSRSEHAKNSHLRSADTIRRLKMYVTGKAVRNKEGTVVGGQYMMGDRAGDTKITAQTGRIAPDRRWFGNTRVVSPEDLDGFRRTMAEGASDPYSVVLGRKKLPLGLLRDAAEHEKGAAGRAAAGGLLASEPFETATAVRGKGRSARKRVKVEQYMVARGADPEDGGAPDGEEGEASQYAALLSAAAGSSAHYATANGTSSGAVQHGRDRDVTRTSGEGVDWRPERKQDLFLKGQSRRIWGEFHKVVDSSDVVLHVIDARDVPGTRCAAVERHIARDCPHKHLVFVLNKVDLVPGWAAKRWLGELAKDRPSVAFHASPTHAFGKGALISLLRQFGKLMTDKKHISVGVVGYPNVGKSSVINTLIGKKSCKVAPVPGETKIWQYVTLMKRIYLIDCPGVVVDTSQSADHDDSQNFKDFHGDASEVGAVLRGVVRAERLDEPLDFVPFILTRVKREHVAALYSIPGAGDKTWTDATHLCELLAIRSGRLLKGGEPCRRTSAVTIINDYQRGRLPHYVAPPDLKAIEEDPAPQKAEGAAQLPDGVTLKKQDMEGVGSEHAEKAGDAEDAEIQDEEMMEDGDEGDADDSDEDEEEDDDALPPVVVVGGEWDDTM